MRKILILTIVFCLVLPISPNVYALASDYTNTQALNWVKSKKGQGIDFDGAYGYQCVDLIKAYYNYLVGYAVLGNGDDYATNSLPSGWTRTAGGTPQPGDILVYAGGGTANGHVCIYESDYSTWHQNWGYSYVHNVTNKHYKDFKTSDGATYWGCIHPNFKSNYADHGTDFYAYIIQTTEWRHLEARDGNVIVGQYGNDGHDPKQIWHFTKNSDGSYFIKNMYNDSMLDNYCEGTVAGNNVGAVEYNGCNAQKWYIIDTPNGAMFETACAPGLVLDIENGVISPGTNVQIYHRNESNAQLFWIYQLTRDGVTYTKPARPPKSTLTVTPNNTTQTASFSWTTSALQSNRYDTRVYDLRIWKGTDTSAEAIFYESISGLSRTGISLAPGTYVANVTPVNTKYHLWYTWGNYITFKVCKFSNYSVTKAPTASSTGTITGKCTDCSATKSVTLPKLNTTDYSYKVVNAASCSANGTGRYTWKTTTYGTFYFDVAISKTGHSYSYKATKAPTTSAAGTLIGTCSKCSGTTTVSLPKLNTTDYSYKVVNAASCSANGTGRYTWKTTTYGTFYFDASIPTTAHTSVTDVGYTATCTATGLTEGSHCSECGKIMTAQEILPAIGHTVVTDEAIPASCTATGLTEGSHCSVCNEILTVQNVIPAFGHSLGDWYTAGEGLVRRDCKNCDYGETMDEDLLELAAPVVTASANRASGKTDLSWDPVVGADFYRVYRATSKNGSYKRIASTSRCSYSDSSCKVGTNYYYKVKAVSDDGDSSEYSSVVNRVCDLKRPSVTITRTSSGKPYLKWKDISGAKKYYVYRATSEDGDFSYIGSTTSEKFVDKKASKGRTYFYRVKAIHSKSSANSAYSPVKSIRCK